MESFTKAVCFETKVVHSLKIKYKSINGKEECFCGFLELVSFRLLGKHNENIFVLYLKNGVEM